MKKILAISGGGCKGCIPARFLLEIEKRTEKKLSDLFSLYVGTSTGSILTTLATTPKNLSMEEALSFYYTVAPKIFKKGFLDYALFGSKYNINDLAKNLRECLGEYTFADIPDKKVMIPTTNADTIDATFIKSWSEDYLSMPLWAAAACSSAAQTYFDAFKYNGKRYIDGGNFNNNPAASALFESFRLWPGESYLIVHLGTGKQNNPSALPNGGLIKWAPLVFGTTSECQDDCALYYCKYAPANIKLFSFDIYLDKFPAMDDCNKKTLDKLVNLAEISINSDPQLWDSLIPLLLS